MARPSDSHISPFAHSSDSHLMPPKAKARVAEDVKGWEVAEILSFESGKELTALTATANHLLSTRTELKGPVDVTAFSAQARLNYLVRPADPAQPIYASSSTQLESNAPITFRRLLPIYLRSPTRRRPSCETPKPVATALPWSDRRWRRDLSDSFAAAPPPRGLLCRRPRLPIPPSSASASAGPTGPHLQAPPLPMPRPLVYPSLPSPPLW